MLMTQQTPKTLSAGQREQRRLEAGRLLLTPLSKAEIARRVGVSRSAVTQWAQQLKKRRRGLNGLYSRKHTGRPPRLTKADWRHVLMLLRRGAMAAGFATDIWTLARIQELIQREFGVSYSKSYLAEKLKVLGRSSKGRVLKEPVKFVPLQRPYNFFTGYYNYRRGWWKGW